MVERYLCLISTCDGQEELLKVFGPVWEIRERAMRTVCLLPFSFFPASVPSLLIGLVIIGPGSNAAYFLYLNEDRIKEILRFHRRVPITVRGRTLRIERAVDRQYSLSPGPVGDALDLGKPLDPATSGVPV